MFARYQISELCAEASTEIANCFEDVYNGEETCEGGRHALRLAVGEVAEACVFFAPLNASEWRKLDAVEVELSKAILELYAIGTSQGNHSD